MSGYHGIWYTPNSLPQRQLHSDAFRNQYEEEL